MTPAIDFTSLVALLAGAQTHRVWSLVITVFGDLAQAPDAWISSKVLNRITGLTGIKPEATRVALHRLRKEGWIDSRRDGRSSEYALTYRGRVQSAAASPRIYASGPTANEAWLVVTEPGASDASAVPEGFPITSNIFICPDAIAGKDVFQTELKRTDTLPRWMADKVCDAKTCRLADELADRLTHLQKALPGCPQLGPLEIVVLRMLVVHSWRRIVLRVPDLPDHVFPQCWSGSACRSLAASLLAKLPAPRLERLEENVRSS